MYYPFSASSFVIVAVVALVVVVAYVIYRVFRRYRFVPRFVFGRTRHDDGPYVELVSAAVVELVRCRVKMRGALPPFGDAQAVSAPAPAATVHGLRVPLTGDLWASREARQSVRYFATGLDEPASGAVDDVLAFVFRTVLLDRLGRLKKLPAPVDARSDPRWVDSWITAWAGFDEAYVLDLARSYGPDVVVRVAETPLAAGEVRAVVRRLVGDDEMTRRVKRMAESLSVMEASWRLYGLVVDVMPLVRHRGEISVEGDALGFSASPSVMAERLSGVRSSISESASGGATAEILAYLRGADATVVAGVRASLGAEGAYGRAGRKYRTDVMLSLSPVPTDAPEAVRTALLSASADAPPVVTGGVPWALDLAVGLRALEVLLGSLTWAPPAPPRGGLDGDSDEKAQRLFGPLLAAARAEVFLLVAKYDLSELHGAFAAFEREVAYYMYRRACVSAQVFASRAGGHDAAVELATQHARGVHDLSLAATYLPDLLRAHRMNQRAKVGDVIRAYGGIVQSLVQNWPISVLWCNYDLLDPRTYWARHAPVLQKMSGNAVGWLTTFMDFPDNLFRSAVCLKKCV